MKEIIIQGLGILGFVITVLSFQCKNNNKFFMMQGLGGTVFCVHFWLLGAYGAALYNLVNLFRAVLFAKNDKKGWKLAVVTVLYTAAFVVSVCTLRGELWNITIVALPFVGLVVMSIFMWIGNAMKIRYAQLIIGSPTWLIHNIFNFSIGGIICELFNIVSVIVALVRFKRTGYQS